MAAPPDQSRSPRASSPLRRVAVRLVALALGVLIALGLLELGLRVAGWPAPGLYVDGAGPMPTSRAGAEGGFARGYAGPARLRHGDFDVEVHVNEHGFFERDLEPKRPGEWRIGILGDSMTAGWGVTSDERYPRLWLEALRPRLPDVTTWNLCSPGASTWHNVAFLEAKGDEYELDEIVLAFYAGNDLYENASWTPDAPDEAGSPGARPCSAIAARRRSSGGRSSGSSRRPPRAGRSRASS